ncbi:MAG: hypothetical protein V4604_14195 [Bacteroidota bacterium]
MKFYAILILSIIGVVFILYIFREDPSKLKPSIFPTTEVTAPIEKFTTYKVVHALSVYNECDYLKIETENGKVVVIVDQDQFYEFDSVDLRTVGDQYVVRVRENSNCVSMKNFAEYKASSYLNEGVKLTKKRCFSDAIVHYSKGLKIDSLNDNLYYFRGLNYMFRKNYEAAIVDFLHGYSLLHPEHFDKITIDQLLDSKHSDRKQLISELEQAFSSSDDLKKLTHVEKAMELDDMNDYQRRIAFCFDKLNEH